MNKVIFLNKGTREAEWDRTSVNSDSFYESLLSFENVTTEAIGKFLCILRYGNEGIFSATYEMNVLGIFSFYLHIID